jgi:hypothetical protein
VWRKVTAWPRPPVRLNSGDKNEGIFSDGIFFRPGRACLCLNSEVFVLPLVRPNLRDKMLSVSHLK